MKGARVQTDMEYTSSSCVWKNQIAYILCVSRRVHWYALPPCTLWKALASDTNPVPPLAEFCVPCVPSGTETEKPPPQSSSHRTTQAPCLAPRRPVLAGFHPRWGKRPVPARSGAIWAPQGPVWQKEKKPPLLPVGGEVGGVILKQVKGPGSPTGVPCRVTSPGRAGR